FEPRYRGTAAGTARATVNLGVTLDGGLFYGIYPGQDEFGIDVRTVPGMSAGELRADFESFLGKLRAEDPELDVSVQAREELEWFPPSAIDPAHPLVGAAQAAAREVHGRDVPQGTMPAFTDGTYWHLAG